MTARSARAARHRRIPQRPKSSPYYPGAGDVARLAYTGGLAAPRPW